MKPPFCTHKIVSFFAYLVFTAVLLAAACKPVQPSPVTPTDQKVPAVSPSALPVEDQGDPLAPRVVEIQPPAGQELPLSGEITLHFDQDMDPVKTGAAWKLSGSDQQEISGEITWPDDRSMRYKPGDPTGGGFCLPGYAGSRGCQLTGDGSWGAFAGEF